MDGWMMIHHHHYLSSLKIEDLQIGQRIKLIIFRKTSFIYTEGSELLQT